LTEKKREKNFYFEKRNSYQRLPFLERERKREREREREPFGRKLLKIASYLQGK
jgi:hypothetical protein